MFAARESSTTRQGGARAGFTLIELLIVVVIIGILAAIAVPKFAATKEKAYLAKMKGDLRNLATAQEAYAVDNVGGYYNGALPNVALAYNPSSSVTVNLVQVVPGGWSARATMPGITTKTCSIYFGVAAPVPPATVEGAVQCD